MWFLKEFKLNESEHASCFSPASLFRKFIYIMLIFVLSCLILNLNILTYIVCIFYKVCVLSLFYTCIHSLLPKYAYLSLKSNQNVSFSPIKRKLSTGNLVVYAFLKNVTGNKTKHYSSLVYHCCIEQKQNIGLDSNPNNFQIY